MLLREIAQAIATLSPDRAGMFLLEQALVITQSRGVVLFTPHEKLRKMVPVLERVRTEPPSSGKSGGEGFGGPVRPSWDGGFLGTCYEVFLDGVPVAWDGDTLLQKGFREAGPESPPPTRPVENQDGVPPPRVEPASGGTTTDGAVTDSLPSGRARGERTEGPSPSETHGLALPVKLSGRPVALLFIYRCGIDRAYSPEHQEALAVLAPFMGALVENFRMHSEMIHKNSRLSALYEISQRAESLIDLRDVYDALEKVVHSFIDYDSYMLHLLGADGRTLEARKEPGEVGFPARITLGEGIIGQAAQRMKPHLTFTKEFNSVLILPIVVSGKLIGVVTIASRKPYAYRDEDIIGLRIITTQIGSVDQLFKDLVRLRGFTQHILESMNSGVLIFDNKGKATFANQEMTRIFSQPFPEGWSPDDPAPALPPALSELMRRMVATNVTIENVRIRLDEAKSPKSLEVNAFPFRDEQGMMLGTAFFVKDITKIVQLEDNLKRADRLSALGSLAAGVAHEIRNPLTGIKMIVQLEISELPPGDSRQVPLEMILREIERLERIVVNLLDFARPSKPRAVTLAIGEVLDACLLLLQNQIKKASLVVEKTVAGDLPPLIGDPDQLKQVFLNILTNAVQATPPGGLLRVWVEARPGWVATVFQDSGVGIPQEKLKAIFDPFMTTKEDGTGLGLPLAQRIIDEHGGRIDVDSTLGRGSTFTVSLPLKPTEEAVAAHG